MARARVHQHVNPLAKYFRELPVSPLELDKLFDVPDQPLHLDIGSGRGRFLLEMARLERDWNFLGTEIREPLVIEANEIRERNGLTNLHYEFCNAPIALGTLLEEIPEGVLKTVSIQFPDPWFKKKHAKRRMVKRQLVDAIVGKISRDGMIYIQTDVEFLAEEMVDLFKEIGELEYTKPPDSLMPVKTEREKSVESRDLPVYRALFKVWNE